MKLTLLRIVGISAATLVVVVYFLNPFHIGSHNVLWRLYGIQLFRVPTDSMEPSIRKGSFVLASAWRYLFHNPMPGEVVVFGYPPDPSVTYLKRIAASAGSIIEIRDCRAIVDGKQVAEPFIVIDGDAHSEGCQFDAFKVPPENYFVLSDRRRGTPDSRVYGPVPRANIYERLLVGGNGT